MKRQRQNPVAPFVVLCGLSFGLLVCLAYQPTAEVPEKNKGPQPIKWLIKNADDIAALVKVISVF